MIKTNYHTHTYLCKHAEGLPEDYIKKAIELGYTEIGISDHGPLFKPWQRRMTMDEFRNIYLKNLNESIEKYHDKIKIYKGLEMEYFPSFTKHYYDLLKHLDYLVLGQHAIIIEGKELDIYKNMTAAKIEAYTEAVIEAMETKMFRILAHPDIYCFSYRTWDNVCIDAVHKIIKSAIKNDCLLEINANGARRGEILTQEGETTWIYPRLEFWRTVKMYPEAKVIINDDAHYLRHLNDEATRKVYAFAKELNLNVVEKLF